MEKSKARADKAFLPTTHEIEDWDLSVVVAAPS